MTEIAERSAPSAAAGSSFWSDAIRKEDWWAIWIGLGLVVVAAALFANGQSIKWIAVAPQKWSHLSQVGTQLQAHGTAIPEPVRAVVGCCSASRRQRSASASRGFWRPLR